MDGVLLAGGLASRLGPITKVTNKHLLPIYDKPMIFYGIETLRDLGCDRVIIILGGNSVGDIVNLVRDGSAFGVDVVYKFQHEPKGISDAIYLAKDIIGEDDGPSYKQFLVLLGDNLFDGGDLRDLVADWTSGEGEYAVFLTTSTHPHDYGQPVLDGREIKYFVEKNPSVNHKRIVTGLYGLETSVFDIIRNQLPSARGEYEITDTLSEKLPMVEPYTFEGFWSDCGTPEGLAQATQYMMMKKGESNVKFGSGWQESSAKLPRVSLSS